MITAEILDRLNSYKGDNIWRDVIEGLGIDEDATDDLDVPFTGKVVVLLDGTVLQYDGGLRRWYDGGIFT